MITQYRLINLSASTTTITKNNLEKIIIPKVDNNLLTWEYDNENGSNSNTSLLGIRPKDSRNVASGQNSFAIGTNTSATNVSSFAQGNQTTASGYYSHAEGQDTTASGYASHAEGNNTTASGYYSHAEGLSTTASGNNSHAEGQSTIASGLNSHAEGNNTVASGNISHAGGVQNTAYSYAETSIGSYSTTYTPSATTSFNSIDRVFNVGNGTSSVARSDAFQVIKDGTVLAPSLEPAIIAAANSKVLITKEYAEANYGVSGEPDAAHLSTAETFTAKKTFQTSNSNEAIVVNNISSIGGIKINNTSGTTTKGLVIDNDNGTGLEIISNGLRALDITQGTLSHGIRITNNGIRNGVESISNGSGNAMRVNVNSSGVGYMAYATTGSTGNLFEVYEEADLNLSIDKKGTIKTESLLKLGTYIVANLPSSPDVGSLALVSDANSITYRGNASGGGSDTALVMYNGSTWVYH